MSRPKGIPASKKQAESGAKNLAEYIAREKAEKGSHMPNLKHGIHSANERRRYTDKRTSEGRQLDKFISAIETDLGGPAELNAAQQTLIGILRGKFITIFQIGNYIDCVESIIEQGALIPVLASSYLSYSESIRRDLETLYGMNRSNLRRKVPKLEDIIGKGKDK